jgi:hypothetical protein
LSNTHAAEGWRRAITRISQFSQQIESPTKLDGITDRLANSAAVFQLLKSIPVSENRRGPRPV